LLKCYLCGKTIKEKIIPSEHTVTAKWDTDWGIEVYSGRHFIVICLQCYEHIVRFGCH